MTELEDILARLGLSQYLARLIDEGFERWETVLDITEQDLATLNFRLGHRRILQREIASARGVHPSHPLVQQQISPLDESYEPEKESSPKPYRPDVNKQGTTGKRKYRRHPKPDENAPGKPPSAYVMFANRVRDELKGQNLSFTDIAKLVGERWKVLDPEDKEEFEFEAQMAKTKYNSELAEYKKTESYKEYLQYLSEFRTKTLKETSDSTDNRKRPKLDDIPGAGGSSSSIMTNTSSSSTGVTAIMGSSGAARPPTASGSAAGRMGSISSVATTNTSSFPSPSSQSPMIHSSSLPLSSKNQATSPTSPTLPAINRYRDAMLRTTQEQQIENLTSHSHHELDHINLPRIHPSSVHTPHIQQQLSYSRHQPPPLNISPYARSNAPLPAQTLRRGEDSMSSSGSSSAPSLLSLDEGRAGHHRSLPLPTPTPQNPNSLGYFDQRPPPSYPTQPRSPRSHTFPLPRHPQLAHSTSYPNFPSVTSTPQPMHNDTGGGQSSSSGYPPPTSRSM